MLNSITNNVTSYYVILLASLRAHLFGTVADETSVDFGVVTLAIPDATFADGLGASG